ncbi:DNA repair protein RAD16 [Collariella sp. IMI 366227]|nr:DNA repair protein RAD16 [Collariella sp. IMI 366227]
MSAAGTSQPVQPVKLSLPLVYQQKLFEELRKEDELVVLARGLGLIRLITNLLHSYDAAGSNLIVIVGAEDRENAWIGEALAEHAAISMSPRARGLTVVNTDFTSVAAREKMYAAGGIFSITSRILVVDMLTGLLNPETITGIVVLHADRVVATSLEAFILRIYRQKNKVGFLKAFSDNPDPFTTGFSPLATMMRNLFLRKASLWPRFHVHVAQALEGKKKAEVIELEVPMTESMREIQNSVMECVEVSIHELKKSNTGLEMDDWNLDSALLKNFDVIVRRQLDPNWHRVSWKTKQIVGDLTVLRGMLQTILALDAVTFLQQLDTIHAAHLPTPGMSRQTQSPWLFLDAAQTIFESAKRRVYSSSQRAGPETINIDALRPVLEEQPKWAVLAEVLEEIDRDLYFEPAARDDSNGTILIMCSDTNTCRQLRDYLQTMHVKPRTEKKVEEFHNPEEDKPSAAFMMRRKLRNYLRWKREFAQVNAALFSENQKAINGAVDPRLAQTRGRAPPNKRRRVRGGGTVGAAHGRLDNGSIAQYFEKPEEVAELMAEVQITEEETKQKEDIVMDPLENMDDYYQLYEMQDLVVIHAYDGDQDEHILEEIKPKYIIMYEPDASFIRRVEVYRSSHNDRNVRVYFLYYGGSVEEQRYLSTVRREKDAFTKLIKERASMSVVLTTDAHGAAEDPQEAFLRTINTRIAGGGKLAATAQPPRIVVDVREFRSSLPSLLHGRSMVIVPCMLTVGDYILSPSICVERKSVSDLIGSFKDGRLFNQCEAMFAHYRNPMLLIEFDQNRSFTLEPFADLSGSLASLSAANAGGNDLQSKIVLLTLAFPKLRIIWSSSPYETAEIFERLKAHEEEPDPIAAVRAGLDGGAQAEEQVFNSEPQDMLAAVPGVTPKNIMNLVLATENVKEVANMTAEELEPMVGREAAGKISGFFAKDLLEDE